MRVSRLYFITLQKETGRKIEIRLSCAQVIYLFGYTVMYLNQTPRTIIFFHL
jgi:hypothetical protein